jgi:type I restriction enzyme, R subunit
LSWKRAVYKQQVEGNADEQNRKLAQESIIGEIVRKQRRKDMSLYKNYAEDPDFRKSVQGYLILVQIRLVRNDRLN